MMGNRFQIIITLSLMVACGNPKHQVTEEEPFYEPEPDTVQVTDELPEPDWDYTEIYGRYISEGGANGYTSVLTLEPQGLNIAFTLHSSNNENCQGEAEGDIAMVDHKEYYDMGYWIQEDCKIEFNFRRKDKKVDIVEINVCTLHSPRCSFEGTYSKIE